MKIILYTQRVEIVESYGERRDCADQRIPEFLQTCGYLPVPVPNIRVIAERMLEELKPAGIVLTGGNSLVRFGGEAPERDITERCILEYALERQIPVYGFCRGMQVILDYFGCELERIDGHVAVRHGLSGQYEGMDVNSFHNQACFQIREPLEVMAKTEDGVIEAVRSREKSIIATMWHPEREHPFVDADVRRVQELFG